MRLVIAAATTQSPLSNISLAWLLGVSITALLTVVYALIRGKLRPEAAVHEIREDRDSRIAEARTDRDNRLEEAARTIEHYKAAFENIAELNRSQEILLRESVTEIGKQLEHVITSLQSARNIARERESGHDA